MPWKVSGRSLELCNCKAFCPCWMGPDGEVDGDNCSSIFGFDVESGESDGVELGGTRVVFMARWPGNFFGGNGNARLYIDEAASDKQRQELEAIFSGRKGGLLEGLWGAVLKEWQPAVSAKIAFDWGDTPNVRVDGVGEATLKPFEDGAGNVATMSGTAAQAGFQIDSMVVASGKGSKWDDPDLGSWEGDSATLHRFDWTD